MTIFNFYADPGHGWVKVPKKLIEKLEIEEEISHYSYMKGDFVFLEEDSDLPIFEKAMIETGKKVNFRCFNSNRSSKIRNYNTYEV